QLIPYTLLALVMVELAMLYTRTFYGITYLFRRLSIPNHFKPALGAFLSGVLALVLFFAVRRQGQVLAVLSFGYGILQAAMSLPAADSPTLSFGLILVLVALGKIVTTSLTIGSGGSGGVFGPSMVIGGCGGGALGALLHWAWPAAAPHPASFVLIG